MRRLRTLSTRRLVVLAAAVAALAGFAVAAQAALRAASPPPPLPLDRAITKAVNAPPVQGVTARVTFTNKLIPAGALAGGRSPLTANAKGRLWWRQDGAFRLELQSDEVGDAQIVSDGHRVTLYDPASRTAYRATLPAERAQHEPRRAATPGDVSRALAELGRNWDLSGARPGTTGGQGSYTVRVTPKDQGGLLGAAELAWDAAHGVPLRAAVYAQDASAPVLELAATDVSYGPVPDSVFAAGPPAGTKVVDLNPAGHDRAGRPAEVHGVRAVKARLDFPLSAPSRLAGLPRTDVRLVDVGGRMGALSLYGEGFGGIAVLQYRATGGQSAPPSRDAGLPAINIDGATGTELATALGTAVRFTRAGVSYAVLGSVPPEAAENAARGL